MAANSEARAFRPRPWKGLDSRGVEPSRTTRRSHQAHVRQGTLCCGEGRTDPHHLTRLSLCTLEMRHLCGDSRFWDASQGFFFSRGCHSPHRGVVGADPSLLIGRRASDAHVGASIARASRARLSHAPQWRTVRLVDEAAELVFRPSPWQNIGTQTKTIRIGCVIFHVFLFSFLSSTASQRQTKLGAIVRRGFGSARTIGLIIIDLHCILRVHPLWSLCSFPSFTMIADSLGQVFPRHPYCNRARDLHLESLTSLRKGRWRNTNNITKVGTYRHRHTPVHKHFNTHALCTGQKQTSDILECIEHFQRTYFCF